MFMADVGATLSVLNVPEQTITEVMKMLQENADSLEEQNLNPINKHAFGQSSWGSQLGFDAGLAQQVVAKEVLEMVAGLRGYRQNIQKFAEDVTETDEDSRVTLQGLQASTECVASPTFDAPGQCTLPTGDDA